MKKRFLAMALCLCMIFALAACGGTSASTKSAGESTQPAETEAAAPETSEAPAAASDSAKEPASLAGAEPAASLEDTAEATSDTEIVRTYTEAEPLPFGG